MVDQDASSRFYCPSLDEWYSFCHPSFSCCALGDDGLAQKSRMHNEDDGPSAWRGNAGSPRKDYNISGKKKRLPPSSMKRAMSPSMVFRWHPFYPKYLETLSSTSFKTEMNSEVRYPNRLTRLQRGENLHSTRGFTEVAELQRTKSWALEPLL